MRSSVRLEAEPPGFLGFREFAQLFTVLLNGLLFELSVSLLEGLKLGIDQIYHGQVAIHVDGLA